MKLVFIAVLLAVIATSVAQQEYKCGKNQYIMSTTRAILFSLHYIQKLLRIGTVVFLTYVLIKCRLER